MNSLLPIFSKSCRRSIVQMVCNSQSGHPGGSLSSLDFLTVLYTKILGKTGEKLVVSNGHISPAVYSVLAEMGYIDKNDVVENFRKFGSKFEGHVTRHVNGIWFGTGPLGVGISAAAGFAVGEKKLPLDKGGWGDFEIREMKTEKEIEQFAEFGLIHLWRSEGDTKTIPEKAEYVKNEFIVMFGLFQDETLIGIIAGKKYPDEEKTLQVRAMIVHPEHRRRGIATYLINFLNSWGIQKGFKKSLLWAFNDSLGFYNSLPEYINTGKQRDELGNGILDHTLFEMDLEKIQSPQPPLSRGRRVFCVVGDGECQEGQVYETLLFAAKEKLNNFVVFVDWNEVQLTDSLEKVMPTDLPKIFGACGWNVLEIDGHNFEEIEKALENASMQTEKPTAILGKTIMGKGVEFMEKTGREKSSAWHGKAPKKEDTEKSLANELFLTQEEEKMLENFREKEVLWEPKKAEFPKSLTRPLPKGEENSPLSLRERVGAREQVRIYPATEMTDCRTAYGMALLDLAKENQNILALTADLRSSVMTKFVASELPDQHIEMGIAEQNMVSVSGGLSLSGFVPFCSTFGAFMSSRAKDQARVNDINECNVKMVATHCGLSVGEDGPTHQAIDDMGSFLGMFNTHICEPADPNHCDRLIRFAASVWGNFYIRMGRHKIPVLTKENGEIFFDENYECVYGKCDVYREGSEITIVATGATVCEAEKARKNFLHPEKVEIVIASSVKKFDETLEKSLRKNKKIITVEDHNIYSGLFAGVSQFVQEMQIPVEKMIPLGATHYQLSGTPAELYKAGKIDAEAILEALQNL